MRTPQEALMEELKDPEFAKMFGAAQAKSNLGLLLMRCCSYDSIKELSCKQMAEKMGISDRRYNRIMAGDANPRVGEVGAMFAALGLRLRFSVEPLAGGD